MVPNRSSRSNKVYTGQRQLDFDDIGDQGHNLANLVSRLGEALDLFVSI